MAKRVKVIGSCPFCRREVGGDMRPINEVDAERLEEILNAMPTVSSSSSHLSVNSETVGEVLQDANAISQCSMEDDSFHNPTADFTDRMLDLIQEEFERPHNMETQITNEHAEVIMAMLQEEQRAYGQYLNRKQNKRASKRRRQ